MDHDEQPAGDEPRRRSSVRTQCAYCQGSGDRPTPRMWSGRLGSTKAPKWSGTLVVGASCKPCGGTGWFEGF